MFISAIAYFSQKICQILAFGESRKLRFVIKAYIDKQINRIVIENREKPLRRLFCETDCVKIQPLPLQS